MAGSYKGISLFSGAGGMDIGFTNAGVSVLLANDIDRDACKTYSKNHPNPIVQGDIRNHLSSLSQHKGVDFVFGGPPCQGFSVAGKMNPNDERSTLIRTFMDVVEAVEPKAFVCENVKALATLNKWHPVRNELIQRASERYSVALMLLNAEDFGVPQARERMFLIGIHKDILDVSQSELESHIDSLLDASQQTPPTISDIVKKLGRAGCKANPRICNAKITFAKVPVLRKSAYAGMLFNGAGRPVPSGGSSSTLPASMGGNKTPIIDEGEIFDKQTSFVEAYHKELLGGKKARSGEAPSRLRRMTVDECAAIQTFPEDYIFEGSQSAVYRQIGNAVPAKLAEAVARAVIKTLKSSALEREFTMEAAE